MPATSKGCRAASRMRWQRSGRFAESSEIGDQDGELVAADPRDRVVGAHKRCQAAGEFADQLVAGWMTVPVVYFLEAVEVDVEEGARYDRCCAMRASSWSTRSVRSVRLARPLKRIVEGQEAAVCLGFAKGGDVGDDGDEQRDVESPT